MERKKTVMAAHRGGRGRGRERERGREGEREREREREMTMASKYGDEGSGGKEQHVETDMKNKKKKRRNEGTAAANGGVGGGGGGGSGKRSRRSAKQIGDDIHLAAKSKAKKMLKGVGDRKLRANATEAFALGEDVAIKTSRAQEWLLPTSAGILEPENEMEKTYRVSQREIAENVDIASSSKVMNLKLEELGPYSIGMNASGRFSLLIGRKGHLALMEWKRGMYSYSAIVILIAFVK